MTWCVLSLCGASARGCLSSVLFTVCCPYPSLLTLVALTSPHPSPCPAQERAIDDAVNVAKALAKDGRLVPGAGATEMQLAHRIAKLAAATPGLEQYAINKYAESLEVVPRVLSESSGLPASDVVSALYGAHANGQSSAGVDVDGGNGGVLVDAVAGAVCDAAVVKASALRLASEVAITVLRVDTIIMAKCVAERGWGEWRLQRPEYERKQSASSMR